MDSLPLPIRWLLLGAIGACVGSAINWAIYHLAYVQTKASPWMKPPAGHVRRWTDRIPIIGWFFLRRESDQQNLYPKRHWLRPFLIELGCAAGLIWLYQWHGDGGLYGGQNETLIARQSNIVDSLHFGWFLFHATLFALLIVATFIDFDEQTIPDSITIPGTLFALTVAAFAPQTRLPVVSRDLLEIELTPLNYWTPDPVSQWHTGIPALLVGIGIVLVWCLALLPKRQTLRYGLWQGIKIMIASVVRPARKTESQVPRVQTRRMFGLTKRYLFLLVPTSILICVTYFYSTQHWTSLYDSLLGMAMGGGIVWAVRLIASGTLRVEAMGFGDVTLMCMIGAFLGWQPALLVFVCAPFTSLVFAVAQLLIHGENRLAFGPYLCLATVIIVVGWNRIWNQWAMLGAFSFGGSNLLLVVFVCLILMAAMLGAWGILKRQFLT